MFIACQSREGDLEEFFAHENQAAPPSLSDKGNLRPAKAKSGIIDCILLTEHAELAEAPPVEAKILDGPAIVNMLQPGASKTFKEYSLDVFIPFIKYQMQNVNRLDIVWDRYFANSLKINTRENRGAGVRRKVTSSGAMPKNWKSFPGVARTRLNFLSTFPRKLLWLSEAQVHWW